MGLYLVTAHMGFGNLLYVYLAAHAWQKKYQVPIHFLLRGSSPTRKHMNEYASFRGLSYPPAPPRRSKILQNLQLGYFDVKLSPTNWVIQGYFQSWKFWEGYSLEELITPVFRIPPPFEQQTLLVHIRRGDYLTSSIHYQLPTSYYLKGLQMIYSNQRVIITSDDIPYCKTLPFESYSPEYLEESDPEKVFGIMCRCSDFILANSTFSVLAYLSSRAADKKCVVNGKWFNDREVDLTDIFPSLENVNILSE